MSERPTQLQPQKFANVKKNIHLNEIQIMCNPSMLDQPAILHFPHKQQKIYVNINASIEYSLSYIKLTNFV